MSICRSCDVMYYDRLDHVRCYRFSHNIVFYGACVRTLLLVCCFLTNTTLTGGDWGVGGGGPFQHPAEQYYLLQHKLKSYMHNGCETTHAC